MIFRNNFGKRHRAHTLCWEIIVPLKLSHSWRKQASVVEISSANRSFGAWSG